jgi:glutathione reductase (NADPH)
MSAYDYDLFVIGAGSGGVRAARMSAAFGAKVAIAEDYRVGGTCVIRGCVPKKLLAYAAHFAEDFEDARGFGWTVGESTFSWPDLIRNKDTEIARLSAIYSDLLTRSGVTSLTGRAIVKDRHTVAIDGQSISARFILVATGGWPQLPAVPGIEHAITSNEAFELEQLPRRVLIVGGGYIAVEFAGIFHGLGSQVTVVYRGAEILRGFDHDVRSHLHEGLVKKGIGIQLNADVAELRKTPQGITAVMRDGSLIAADAVMYATGRRANTAGLGLAECGVKLDKDGGVSVDARCQSSVDNIYAIGDVTHRYALTPVAIREGAAVANTLFGGVPTPVDHDTIPSAVFSQPPVGTVGMTEEVALKQFASIDVYRTRFRPLKATLSGRDERTLMKLLVDSATQRVLGAHMVGADAPEIIQGVAIAVKAGLTKQQFDATVAIHPTAAEEFVTLRDKQVVTA